MLAYHVLHADHMESSIGQNGKLAKWRSSSIPFTCQRALIGTQSQVAQHNLEIAQMRGTHIHKTHHDLHKVQFT